MVGRVGLDPASYALHAREPDARTRTCESDSNFEEIELQSKRRIRLMECNIKR